MKFLNLYRRINGGAFLSIVVLAGVGIAGCSLGQNQISSGNGVENQLTEEEKLSDYTENDNKTYSIPELILSGKPFILINGNKGLREGKNGAVSVKAMIKDNKIYIHSHHEEFQTGNYVIRDSFVSDWEDITIGAGEYAKMSDEKMIDTVIEKYSEYEPNVQIQQEPIVLAVYSDKTGNYLDSIECYYTTRTIYNGKDGSYVDGISIWDKDDYDKYESVEIYDSFFDTFYSKSYRTNKPIKTAYVESLDQYSNMEGLLFDPTAAELEAAKEALLASSESALSSLTSTNNQENDEKIMSYLKSYYESHDKTNNFPVVAESRGYKGYYDKYAIADFDADGKNELAVECKITESELLSNGEASVIEIYEADGIDFSSSPEYRIPNGGFAETKFFNNGVAEVNSTYDSLETATNKGDNAEAIDNKRYILFNDNLFEYLNYNKDNIDKNAKQYMVYFYRSGGEIHKTLREGADGPLDVVKTQEQYTSDKDMLRSGRVIDLQIKDYTATNLE